MHRLPKLNFTAVSRRLRIQVFGLVSLRILLAALIGVEVLLVGAWWSLGRSAFIQDWFPNLGTELVAIILGLVVVDEVLRRERRHRYAQTRAIAANAILEPLLPLMPRALAVVLPPWPPFQHHPEYRDAQRLFADWLHQVEKAPMAGYDVWDSLFRDLRRVADSWRQVTGRYASALDDEVEVDLVESIDDYVGWTTLTRDQLDWKLQWFSGHLQNIRNALSEDSSLDPEELWTWAPHGDPRPSIAKFHVSALRRIVRVLDLHSQAFRSPPLVPESVLKAATSPTPSSAITAQVHSDPLELDTPRPR